MRVAFYFDYDKYQRDEAPGILPFVQVLRDRGHSVDFITSEKELLEKIKKDSYDVAAISVLSSIELGEVLETAVRVKKLDPCVVTVLGGQGVSSNAEKLADALGVDMVVEGEGGHTLPAILEHVRRAKDSKGVVAPFKGEVELTKQQMEFFKKETLDLLLNDRVFYKSPVTGGQASELSNATFERTIENIRIFVPISRGMEKAYEKSKKAWEREHPNKFPCIYAPLFSCRASTEAVRCATKDFRMPQDRRRGYE